jgi:hypothetical protein
MCLTLEKAKETSAQKCIAKKSPVINWVTRHNPKRDPKFHKDEILEGVGKSTSAPLAIFKTGWVFKIDTI